MVFVRYICNQTIERIFFFVAHCKQLFVMLGVRSGFLALVKQKNPNVIEMHCIIHREALASRTMPQSLKKTLNCAIKVVNYIKASALNTRIFVKFCQDIGTDYDSLLFHTSVRWLSRGNMLIRLVRLLPEVCEFLEIQHKQERKAEISDVIFQIGLAFLAGLRVFSF